MTFDGTYANAKSQSEQFNNYKRNEKRQFIAEKTDLESLLGNIQTKVKTYGLKAYNPPLGLLLSDLDTAWRNLGKTEAQCSKAINAKIGSIKEGLRRSFAEKANEFSLLLDTISFSITKFEGALEVLALSLNLT